LFFKLLNIRKKYFKIGIVVHNSIDEIYSSILSKSKIKRFLLEYIFLNVDVIVVLEEYIKKQALNIINSSLEKKFIVAKHPVLDMTNSIIDETYETSKRRIFFVGTATKSKGIDLLLEALNILDTKYYKFLEIGIFGNIENTKLLKDYEEVLKKIKVKNEFIPYSEYYKYIRQAEYLFMLQTKYRARVSGALFDAFSFNKPIISTSMILKYYEDYYGPLGFVIPADARSLCSILISIARKEDKEVYAEFVKNIERLKKDHSLEQFYTKIREVIRLLYE
jgi:glycosyltransferase involved in cell wall biosynthesis